MAYFAPLMLGLPEVAFDLLGIISSLLLVLMVVAAAGIVYRLMTGGIEWPEDKEDDEDALTRGSTDDEWDYY